jgi:hypothetical protein
VDDTSESGTYTGRKRLYKYLSICLQGSVIVTTRNRKMAAKLVDDADMVTVEPMGEQIALDLLKIILDSRVKADPQDSLWLRSSTCRLLSLR